MKLTMEFEVTQPDARKRGTGAVAATAAMAAREGDFGGRIARAFEHQFGHRLTVVTKSVVVTEAVPSGTVVDANGVEPVGAIVSVETVGTIVGMD